MSSITETIRHQSSLWASPGLAHKVSDGFAAIEKHNLRVAKVTVCPSVVHRFVFAMGGNIEMEVNRTHSLVGCLWGAEVSVDPGAPPGGFSVLSENDTRVVRVEGPFAPVACSDGLPTVFCKDPVTPEAVMELLDLSGQRGGGNLRLELQARTYAGFRKFGRGIIDIESDASALKTGLQGTIFGVQVLVSRLSHPTRIVLKDDSQVYGILETDSAKNTSLKENTDRVLGGEGYEPYVDRLVAGISKGLDEARASVSYDFEDARLKDVQRFLLTLAIQRLREKYELGQ